MRPARSSMSWVAPTQLQALARGTFPVAFRLLSWLEAVLLGLPVPRGVPLSRLAVAAPYPMAGFVRDGRFICVTGPPQLTPSCAMLPSAFIPLGGRCRRLHQSASRSPERMPRRGLPTAPPPAAVGSRSAESESPSSLRVLVSQSRPRDACLLVLRFWRRGIIGQLGAASPCVRDSSQPAPFCAAPSRPPILQWRQSRRARASLFLSAGNRREGRALLASLALRLVAALCWPRTSRKHR